MAALHRSTLALSLALLLFPAPAQVPAANAGALQASTLSVSGHQRNYGLYVPAGLPPGRPLVVMLHGTGSTGSRMREATLEQMDRLADREGFAVAYPDALHGAWTDCRKTTASMQRHLGIDDVAFLRALIADARARASVDPGQVFLFGFSGGGHMAMRMAWEAEGELGAIAVVAANLPAAADLACTPRGRTRVMLMKGTADALNPYQGGPHAIGGTVLSAADTARTFARLGEADGPGAESVVYEGTPEDRTAVSLVSWKQGPRPAVVLYTVRDGGHNMPLPAHKYPPQAGVVSRFDSLRAAWQFFTAR